MDNRYTNEVVTPECKIDAVDSVYLEDFTNSYKVIYECEIKEKDFKEEAVKRARGLAALQRLYCVDYDYWL